MNARYQKTSRNVLLAGSLLTSLLVHAAGLSWFYSKGPVVEIASGQASAITIVGSLEDLIAGSQAAAEVLPVEKHAPLVQHEVTEPIKAAAPEKLIEPTPKKTLESVTAPLFEGMTQKSEDLQLKLTEQKKVSEEPLKSLEQSASLKVVEPFQALKAIEEEKERLRPKEIKPVVPESLKPVEAEEHKPEVPEKKLAKLINEKVTVPEVVPVPRKAPKRPETHRVAKKAQKARVAGNAKVNQRKGATIATVGKHAGRGGGRQGAASEGAGNAAKDNYLGKVQRKLQRAAQRVYPKREQRRGIEGAARVSFVIHQNGSVTDVRVVRSSGNQRLDKAAIKAVSRAAPFGKAPFSSSRYVVSIIFAKR